MRSRMFLVLAAVAFGLLLCCSPVFAEERGEIYEVDILHDGQGWHIEPCPLPGHPGDTWRIRNRASDTVCVWILIMVGDKNQFWYTLAPADSADHLAGSWDCGIEVFLGVCPGAHPAVARCERPCGPSLTQWGAVALMVALTSVGIWILSRRRVSTLTSG